MKNTKVYGKTFNVRITGDNELGDRISYDAQLFFVISGTMFLKEDDKESVLEIGDYVFVSPGMKYSYYLQGKEHLLMNISVSYMDFCELLSEKDKQIMCNSAEGGGKEYEHIRRIFNRILGFMQYEDDSRQAAVCGLLYELMYEIIISFSIQKTETGQVRDEEERIAMIVSYLNANFRSEITLKSLSDYLGLTKEYVSKYITKKMGCSFLQYLDSIRMEHAEEELRSTDKTVLDIALDNGYSSAAAFARSVKKKYGITPQQYRTENRNSADNMASLNMEITEKEEILEQIQRYVNKHKVEENISENVIQRQIEIDSRAGARWVKNWNKLINIENARELLKKEIQDMILKFKKELGIEYVSVNNIWDAELYLLQEKELYLAFNFNSLDSIIDFLVRNDLHPYINLDWTAMAAKEILHEKKEVHERFLREFLDHYYGIYGQIEVSHWIIGEVQRAGAEDKRYFNCFDTTWNKMRELSDSLAIVGGMDGEQSKEEFICYIREWKKSTQLPDYLVLKGIAFRNKNSGETVDKWGISYQNKDYLQEKLWAYRKTMDANGWAQVKIMISEWDFSDSDSNVLNDNIFKGAWIMRNAINSIGFADIMGYHSGMDRITRKASSDLLLSGQSGLLNHNGIGKPAYFAMRFLKEGKESLLMRDDNGMITTDNYGHFTILCHNYKHPNYHYFSMDESEVDNKDILHFFSDQSILHLRYSIHDIREGKWSMRLHTVNEESGNLREYWKQLNQKENMIFQDIEYLRHICRPKLEIKTIESQGRTLNLDIWLKPNEFQYIHLFHLRNQ